MCPGTTAEWKQCIKYTVCQCVFLSPLPLEATHWTSFSSSLYYILEIGNDHSYIRKKRGKELPCVKLIQPNRWIDNTFAICMRLLLLKNTSEISRKDAQNLGIIFKSSEHSFNEEMERGANGLSQSKWVRRERWGIEVSSILTGDIITAKKTKALREWSPPSRVSLLFFTFSKQGRTCIVSLSTFSSFAATIIATFLLRPGQHSTAAVYVASKKFKQYPAATIYWKPKIKKIAHTTTATPTLCYILLICYSALSGPVNSFFSRRTFTTGLVLRQKFKMSGDPRRNRLTWFFLHLFY